MSPFSRRLAVPLAALFGAGAASPQTPAPTPRPFTLEVETSLVSVTAVVQDKSGAFIRGLGPGDVVVTEDGVKQEVAFFREASGPGEEIPLSVVLVLDSSGSMRNNMRFLQEAAITFVNKLEDVDKALVVDFNSGVRGSAEFTEDVSRLERFVDALQAWGGTSLYDAIHYGLNRIKDQPGRKAVIVFSDGDDTTSSLGEKDVIDYARAVEATVYCVGIRGGVGLMDRGPRGFLRKVAKETGGQYFFPEKVGDLIRIFSGISDELHNHYLLGYSPQRPPDGTWREIEVKLGRKDAQLRVRKGYFAVKRLRPTPPPATDDDEG
ncbi:MAG TPA: VWA domain-containing protein [Vicinamibacteria bacterium]|nr:VWA domain-containing protein [Vicinamibacteria bacterium]